VTPAGQTAGFFTGYYETEVDGSRFPSDEYTIPIYAAPAETVRKHQSKVFADLDRTRIEDGALAGKELEICYVKNPVDAFFAQIQGSTRVKLDNGKLLRLNYVASNGMPYTPIGKFLIDRGIVSKEEMSMDKIREFMETNPDEGKELRRKNRSFVFFQEIPLGAHDECIGAQGVPLTPGRSLAVDKRIHIYGTPVWIDAELPHQAKRTVRDVGAAKRVYQWHGGRHKCPASEAPAGDDRDSRCPVGHGNNVQRAGAAAQAAPLTS
jgi:membrane-bound lytic murein transglycosylase A